MKITSCAKIACFFAFLPGPTSPNSIRVEFYNNTAANITWDHSKGSAYYNISLKTLDEMQFLEDNTTGK